MENPQTELTQKDTEEVNTPQQDTPTEEKQPEQESQGNKANKHSTNKYERLYQRYEDLKKVSILHKKPQKLKEKSIGARLYSCFEAFVMGIVV